MYTRFSETDQWIALNVVSTDLPSSIPSLINLYLWIFNSVPVRFADTRRWEVVSQWSGSDRSEPRLSRPICQSRHNINGIFIGLGGHKINTYNFAKRVSQQCVPLIARPTMTTTKAPTGVTGLICPLSSSQLCWAFLLSISFSPPLPHPFAYPFYC